ncbi:MAG: magnesium-dependent phosphatase-1 [Acidobacteriota bacterium]
MKKLVVFDLDETLWTLSEGYCDLMQPPFRRDGDCVRDATGLTLTLRADARRTLDALQGRGLFISAASRSRPETAGEILRLLRLDDHLSFPCLAWQAKDHSISQILASFRKLGGVRLEPRDVLFVDDWPSNIRDAARLGVQGLLFGRDVRCLSEVLHHLNGSG